MPLFVDGVGVCAPGLNGWPASVDILAGRTVYQSAPLARLVPDVLPPTERRRSGNTVLLALQVASEAVKSAALATEAATVFASSGGDLEISHELCLALAQPVPAISPTRFHNSVHNAAAGYWSIATGCRQSSTSLSCYDTTFAAGLLEAIAVSATQQCAVLFVAYDWPPPMPLHAKRPLCAPFGIGMVLNVKQSQQSRVAIDWAMQATPDLPVSTMEDPGLEALRRGNPAARGLPFFAAIARGTRESVVLDYLDDARFVIGVTPCS